MKESETMAVGSIGAVKSPPKQPVGSGDSLAMLTLLSDPERTAEAKAYLADLNAATEHNAQVTTEAREAVAEAERRQTEAELAEARTRQAQADAEEAGKALAERQAQREAELTRREQQVAEREQAVDRKAAETTAALDVIRRAKERLAEVD